MVVIAAAVCTTSGRALVSRQFVEISRSRIEGLLSAFPKLMSSNSEQNTMVETENVRYLYQPLENLNMLIVTNKSSNIIEDLETLHLMAKLVPTYCGSLDERMVLKNAFELVFALDECVSAGHKEKVTLSRIKTLTEMDSHEEKIHEIVERNKQRSAQETANVKRKEIEMMKKQARTGGSSSLGGIGSTGYGSGMGSASYNQEPTITPVKKTKKSEPRRSSSSRGMQLKAKSTQSSAYLKALQESGDLADEPVESVYGDEMVPAQAVDKKDIHVEVDESISVLLTQDAVLESMELKGELRIEIVNPTNSYIYVVMDKADKKFNFRTHPNINKMRFNKTGTLALKNTGKAFPLRTPLGVLKWRYASNDEEDLPLNITCWPTPGDDMVTVNLEYELLQEHLDLQNVEISVPIPQGNTPVVEQADGSYEFDSIEGALIWKFPVIDKDSPNGSLEFTLPYSGSTSSFFPVDIRFNSSTPYSGVSVKSVNNVKDDSSLDYSSFIHFNATRGDYQVQFQ